MQWTTKVLIRLRSCAGWSLPLLFAYSINRFSHDMAQIMVDSKVEIYQKVTILSTFKNATVLFVCISNILVKRVHIFCPYSFLSTVQFTCDLHDVGNRKNKNRSNFGEVDVAPAKTDKVNKVEKWQKLTAGLNPNHMHIFRPWKKRCAKLHKDRHEIV